MSNYELRLKLIIAKAQLLLSKPEWLWHQDEKATLREIVDEAMQAYDEFDNKRGQAGDR